MGIRDRTVSHPHSERSAQKPGSSNMDTRPSLCGRYTGGTLSAENMLDDEIKEPL